jgi:FkbM family methyltransferase
MYQKHGWYFPDYDTHFADMLDKNITKGNRPVYQEPVRKKSFKFVANKGVALDIGANVGLWSLDIAREFRKVIAYEPVEDFRECLRQNVPLDNIVIESCALGNENTSIDMIITKENTGHSHVDPKTKGSGKIPMYRLDDLDLKEVDYIKIDCEGYEYNILQGAEQTIKKFKPVIVIEQKFHKDVGIIDEGQAYDLLISWGLRELARVRNDVILGF